MIFRTGLNLVGGGLAMVPLVLIVVPIAGTSSGDAAAAPCVELAQSSLGQAFAGKRYRTARCCISPMGRI